MEVSCISTAGFMFAQHADDYTARVVSVLLFQAVVVLTVLIAAGASVVK